MNRSMIMSMPDEQYKDIFDGLLYDDPDFFANITKGHTLDEHIGKTDYELLARANFKEDNNGFVSSFTNREEFIENMQNALTFKMDEITSWIMKKRSEFNTKEDFDDFAFSVDLVPDIVGYGFNANELKKYETTSIRIVLTRDYSEESPLGFYMTTSYPDMTKAQPTKELSISDIEKSKDFSIIEKLYFKSKELGLKTRYKVNESEPCLKIVTDIPDSNNTGRIISYFTEHDYKFKESVKSDDGKISYQKLDTATMLFKNKNDGEKLLKLETYKRKLINEKENIPPNKEYSNIK